jgi:tRNA pseudouridine55 synthase
VVGVGAATKLAPYLTGQDKRYLARFVLGASTTTADAEGPVVDEAPCPADLPDRVPAALVELAAVQSLPPPAYSAIHVGGQRAHVLARAGRPPVLEERPMTVRRLVPGPVRWRGDRVEVDVELTVSKGTYVRALAEELGRRLGVPAHLGALHRTQSGTLSLEHPRALTGLLAEPVLPPDPGPADGRPGRTAPRWRLRLPSCDTRESASAWLRSRLLAPVEVVPLPVLHASDDESGQRALARLASGQVLAWPDPGLPSASRPNEPDKPHEPHEPAEPGERVAVASAEGLALVIARLEAGPTGVRLRPERVVVPPAGHP